MQEANSEENKSIVVIEQRSRPDSRNPSLTSNPSQPPPIAPTLTQHSQQLQPQLASSIRTSHSHAQITQHHSQTTPQFRPVEVSPSVRSINQKLEDISSRVKDGRPVVISYGDAGRIDNRAEVRQQNVQIRYVQEGRGQQHYQHQHQQHHSMPHGGQVEYQRGGQNVRILQPGQVHTQQVYVHQQQHIQPMQQHVQQPPQIHQQQIHHLHSKQQILHHQQQINQLRQHSQPTPQPRPTSNDPSEPSIHPSIPPSEPHSQLEQSLPHSQPFHSFSIRFDSLFNEYTTLRQQLQKCQDISQIQQFKHDMIIFEQRMQEFGVDMAEKAGRDQSNRVSRERSEWKDKYEIVKKAENQKVIQSGSGRAEGSPQLVAKLQELERQLFEISKNNQQTAQNHKQQLQQKQTQIAHLTQQLEQKLSEIQSFQRKLHKHSQTLKSKQDEISTLRMLVQKQSQIQIGSNSANPIEASNNETLSKRIMALKREKEELVRSLNKMEEELDEAREKIQDYKIEIRKKNDQIKRYQYLVQEKDQQLISSISSQAQSNTNFPQQQINTSNNSNSELYATEVKTIRDKLQQYEDQLLQFNSERQALSKKASQYQADLKIKNQIIKDLQEKLSKQPQVVTSQVKINVTERSQQESLDIAQLNENMVQLQKYYREKCAQNEQYKGICNQYEGIINKCKTDYQQLQDKYEEIVRKEKVNTEEEEAAQLKSKVEELERKLKRVHELQSQNQKLKGDIGGIEADMRRVRQQLHNIHSNQQFEELEATLLKKDQEITRLKQAKGLLQTSNDELTLQLQQLKLKTNTDFKTNENQKGTLKQQLVTMQFKIQQSQRKKNSLEEIKRVLEEQISEVTSELHGKIEQMQRLQSQLRQERAKVKSFEDNLQMHLTETEENKLRLKDNQRKNQQLVKSLQNELEKKKQEAIAKTSQAALLNTKIADLESQLKQKTTQISQLQRTSSNLKQKISGFDTYLDEIKYLKQKIIQYESKVSSLAFRPLSRNNNTEPTQIFERKVIYQLKLENQSLRQKLGLGKVVESEEEVRERLTDFNHRLEEVIGENFNGEISYEQNELFKRYERDRRKLIQKHNEEITQLKVKILQLQSGSSDHRKTSKFPSAQSVYHQQILFYRQKNHELQDRVDTHLKVNRELRQTLQKLMKGQNDEYSLNYYKDQLTKTTEINVVLQQKLRKLQIQLRRLQGELERCGSRPVDNSTEYEVRIVELNRRVSQLVLEINLLQEDKVNCANVVASLEQQIFKIKVELEDSNKARQEQARAHREKQTRWEEELAKTNSKIRLQLSQIQRLTELLNKKQISQSSEVQSYRLKFTESQQQLRKLRLLYQQSQSQQQTLKRQISKLQSQLQGVYGDVQREKENGQIAVRKHADYEMQIGKLRGKIGELEGRVRSSQGIGEEWNYKESQYQQEITRLNAQIGMLGQEGERTKQHLDKRLAQKDAEIARLRAALSDKTDELKLLEQQMAQTKVSSSESSQQLYYLQQQLTKIRTILASKTTQLDRQTSELDRKSIQLDRKSIQLDRKTSQFDRISSQLDRKTYQLNRKTSQFNMMSSQLNKKSTQREIKISQLQDTVRKLESELEMLERGRKDSANMQDAISELQRQMMYMQRAKDEEVSRLRQVIDQMEQECREYVSKEHQFSARVRELENQLRDLRLDYEERIRALRVEYQQRMSSQLLTIHSLEDQLTLLRTKLQQKDGNDSNLQGRLRALEIQLQTLKSQLVQKQSHLTQITSQVTTLQQKLTIYQREQHGYRQHISELQAELRHINNLHRVLYEKSYYLMQFLRSSLIGLETVFQEIEQASYAVSQTVGKMVREGLEECQKWNQYVAGA